jgi:hypothetical protein
MHPPASRLQLAAHPSSKLARHPQARDPHRPRSIVNTELVDMSPNREAIEWDDAWTSIL